jgi:chromosome segregation ATPase
VQEKYMSSDTLKTVAGADLGSEIVEILSIVKDLKRELSHSRKIKSSLEEALKEVTDKGEASSALAQIRGEEIASLQEELVSFQETNEDITVKFSFAENARAGLVHEIRQSCDDHDLTRGALQRAEGRIEELEVTKEASEKKYTDTVDEFQAKALDLLARLDQYDAMLATATARHESDSVQIENLLAQKANLENQISLLETKSDGMEQIRQSLFAVRQGISEDQD